MGDRIQNEYESIHLNHLILFLLKKWYVFFIAAVVGCVVFGIYGSMELRDKEQKMAAQNYMSTKKVQISETEFSDVKMVAEYDDLISQQEAYCADSIFMNIDPNKKYSRTDCFYITNMEDGDANTVIDRYLKKVESPEFYEQINETIQEDIYESYYREIILFETVPNLNMFRITVDHFDAEKNAKLADAINKYVKEIKKDVIIESFPHQLIEERGQVCECVDVSIGKEQLAAIQALRETRDMRNGKYIFLSDKQKEYLELYYEARDKDGYEEGQVLEKEIPVEVSKYKVSSENLKGYFKKGILYSVLICFAILIGVYIYSPVLLNPADIEENYHLPLLGVIKVNKNSDEDKAIVEQKVHYLLEQHENKIFNVLFVFGNEQMKENTWNEQVRKNLECKSVQTYTVVGKLDDQENLKVLNCVDALIMVEEVGKTLKKQLRNNKNTCVLLNKMVLGVILYS